MLLAGGGGILCTGGFGTELGTGGVIVGNLGGEGTAGALCVVVSSSLSELWLAVE